MIEQILFFGLGALAAALVWLILLPAFWRRATRITRAAIERNLPLSANAISLALSGRLRSRSPPSMIASGPSTPCASAR
jgi:arginine exporter protein ArgO